MAAAAADVQDARVAVDDLLADPEAEACAGEPLGGEEGVEDAFDDIWRHAGARVGDGEDDAYAAGGSSEEETPLDQRRCDGFMGIVDVATHGTSKATAAPNPFFVVAHVPLEDLVDDAGEKSELAAELEHDGLIDVETVQRIACDATVVVALDDQVGHTMYEGRARRFPSGAQRREVIRRDRHCRFPGCANATFANVHHIVPWKPGGGTDLDNLVLLCRHHHGVVHRKGWSMEGNANEELRIENPSGRVTVSRPSPLWTRVTGGRRAGMSA